MSNQTKLIFNGFCRACGIGEDLFCTCHKGVEYMQAQLLQMTEPCKCDPVGSGEEWCNGGCGLQAQVDAAEKELEKERLFWEAAIESGNNIAKERDAAQEQSKRLATLAQAVITIVVRGSECGFCSEKTLTPHEEDCEVGLLQAALAAAGEHESAPLGQQPDQEPPEPA